SACCSASILVNQRLCKTMEIRRIRCALMSAAVVLFSGCGGGAAGLYGISGTVKVDGAPLEKGNISFEATESQPTSSGAVISGGNFTIPREHGLPEGKYRVVVNAPTPGTGGGKAAADTPPGEGPPPPKELIPP